jgi:hypothetical protein
MFFQATQKRIGESKVIAARAEVDAAKLMRQAADVSPRGSDRQGLKLGVHADPLRIGLHCRSWLVLPLCRSDS